MAVVGRAIKKRSKKLILIMKQRRKGALNLERAIEKSQITLHFLYTDIIFADCTLLLPMKETCTEQINTQIITLYCTKGNLQIKHFFSRE